MPSKLGIIKICLGCLVIISFVILLVINLSGFLPANQRSKTHLCQGAFRSLEWDVKEFGEQSKGELPKSWADLVNSDAEGAEEDMQYLMDPFSGFREKFKVQFETDKICFWSVGPDGKDNLIIENGHIGRKDELVLMLARRGDAFEAKYEGF